VCGYERDQRGQFCSTYDAIVCKIYDFQDVILFFMAGTNNTNAPKNLFLDFGTFPNLTPRSVTPLASPAEWICESVDLAQARAVRR
jgi:hypothetical protein